MMKYMVAIIIALVAMTGITTALVATPIEKDEIARMDFAVKICHDLSRHDAREVMDMNMEYLVANPGMVKETMSLNKIRGAFGSVMGERVGRGGEPSEERQEVAVQRYHDAVAEFLTQ